MCPKVNDPPTALVDEKENIITSDEAIEELTLSTYTKRLENRPIKEGLESHKETSEKLFHLRMKKARSNKTEGWKMSDLEKVLKEIKLTKSRDPFGWANKIFHPDVAGLDLKR